MTPPQEEAIAFNLCSLHGFDPDFVRKQRDFALAVIKEYERSRPDLTSPSRSETQDEGAAGEITLNWRKVETKALEEWRAKFGDYDVIVTHGHDNVWSYFVNNAGLLGFASADEAKGQAHAALTKHLSVRLTKARKTVALEAEA